MAYIYSQEKKGQVAGFHSPRGSRLLGEAAPTRRPSITFPPRVLNYTQKDVIDARISIPAQHALVRLSKHPPTSKYAVALLEAIKQNRLAGIHCVNWEKTAKRALRLGLSWWTIIPRGEDAVLMLDPDNPMGGAPIIAFRRELDPDCGLLKNEKRFAASPFKLDAALMKSWFALEALRTPIASRCLLPSARQPGIAEAPLMVVPVGNLTQCAAPARKITVWSENIDAPGRPCKDARLDDSPASPYPGGTSKGQSGWDMGIIFATLPNLAIQLAVNPTPSHVCDNLFLDCPPIARGQLSRLAIVAHGTPGSLEVNRRGRAPLSVQEIRGGLIDATLSGIEELLSSDAVVLLMGCNAGKGPLGAELLIELSKRWPGRKVAAFTKVMTHGFRRGRAGQQCSEAGYRDTDFETECPLDARTTECEFARYGNDWDNLNKLPWGSELSPHSKIAKDGVIIKSGGE
ncbi:MAG TPA: DUF4347 domain-containing protein [Blastocatellia bacterium]|nr:DUF4347 domain-containing protein [Blastocatellia bacterium]